MRPAPPAPGQNPYFTRSKVANDYKAAGVVPIALHQSSIVVLLGCERGKTGPKGKVWKFMWRDFGGGRESADADSAATAAREFAEESLGLFGDCSVDQRAVDTCAARMAARLREPQQAVRVVHQLKKGQYIMYLTQVPYVSPLMFRLATQQNAATGSVAGGEKTAFAWVPLADLLLAVGSDQRRYRLTCQSAVCGGAGTPPPGSRGCREFHLHPCFANSMRLAQDCGLSEFLARVEPLPLPPAPQLPPAPAQPPASQLPVPPSDSPPDEEPAAAVGSGGSSSMGASQELEEGGDESEGCSIHGPMPEHMSYWLEVETIAVELRAGREAGPTSAAAAGAAAAAAAAAAALVPPPPPPLPDGASVELCSSPRAAVGAAVVAAVPPARLPGAAAEPSASHGSCASDALAAAAAATAAAVAAAVAAVTAQKAARGARPRRGRSRKKRLQQRQRQRQLQEQQQRRQQAQHAGEGWGPQPSSSPQLSRGRSGGTSGPGSSSQRQHSLQRAQQGSHQRGQWTPGQQHHHHHLQQQGVQDTADSLAAAQGAIVAAAAHGQALAPEHHPDCWASAQERLARVLAPHSSPRKRIRLD